MRLHLTGVGSPLQPDVGGALRRPALGRLFALAVFCLLFSAATIAWQFSPRGYLSNEDLWAPMRAAFNLLGTPEQGCLYEALFFARHFKVQYLPTGLLPLELLDGLGAGSPRVLNGLNAALVLVNAGFLGLLADTMLVRFRGVRPIPRAVAIGLGAASGLAFYPISRRLQLGQIQVWLDLAFTAACLLMAHGRFAATSVMASPVAWKHHYGILSPMFIMTSCCLASRQQGVQSYARFGILAAAWVLAASQLNGLADRPSGTVLNVFQATHLIGALLLLLVMASLLHRSSTREHLSFR